MAHQAHGATGVVERQDMENWYGRNDEEREGVDEDVGGEGPAEEVIRDQSRVAVQISGSDLDGYIDLFRGTVYPGQEEDRSAAAIANI